MRLDETVEPVGADLRIGIEDKLSGEMLNVLGELSRVIHRRVIFQAVFQADFVVFLAVAGMRLIILALPEGQIWSGLGYVLSSIGLLAVVGLVAWRATK